MPVNLERSHVVFIWFYHVLWCFIHVFNVIKCCFLSFVIPFLGGYGWLLYRFAIGCSRHGSEVVPRGLEGVLPRKSPGGATWSMGKWWENDDGTWWWMENMDGWKMVSMVFGFSEAVFHRTCLRIWPAKRPASPTDLVRTQSLVCWSTARMMRHHPQWKMRHEKHPGTLVDWFFSGLNYWCQLAMIMKYHDVLGRFGLGNRWKHQLVFHEIWKRWYLKKGSQMFLKKTVEI